jgi:hypothetical protein
MQMTVIITWTNSKRAQMQQIAGFLAHFSLPLSKEDFGAPIHSVREITEAVSLPGFDVVVRPSPDLGATAGFGGKKSTKSLLPNQPPIESTHFNFIFQPQDPTPQKANLVRSRLSSNMPSICQMASVLSFPFVIPPQFPRRQINHFSLSSTLSIDL